MRERERKREREGGVVILVLGVPKSIVVALVFNFIPN